MTVLPQRLLAILLLPLTCGFASAIFEATQVIYTADGPLQGTYAVSRAQKSYRSFKGIPYGDIPGRFEVQIAILKSKPYPLTQQTKNNLGKKLAKPVKAWSETRNAFDYGPRCPSVGALSGAVSPGVENCLYLNIFTPTVSTQLCPNCM